MIEITYINVTDLSKESCTEILKTLPLFRQKKANDYVFERDRRLSIGAGFLLQKALTDHVLGEEEIVEGEFGKPLLKSGKAHFSLSHSGDYAACAFAFSPVGIDIEKQRKNVSPGLLKLIATDEEAEYILSQKDPYDFAHRLWTLKESVSKYYGRGLSLPLKDVEIVWNKPLQIKLKGIVQNLYFFEKKIGDHYHCACGEEDEFSLKEIVLS